MLSDARAHFFQAPHILLGPALFIVLTVLSLNLHKLTKYTQFIVITHRHGTMVAADRLYGITMQEKGVSTLVSVNLIEEDLDK